MALAMIVEDHETARALLEAGASKENALTGKSQEPSNLYIVEHDDAQDPISAVRWRICFRKSHAYSKTKFYRGDT